MTTVPTTEVATDQQLSLWAFAAALFSDRGLAGALTTDEDERLIWHATSLLEQREPEAALELLQADPLAPVAAPGVWPDLAALAARAQRGDLRALQVLAATRVGSYQRAEHARLVALAAADDPDPAIADGAWTVVSEAAVTTDLEAVVNVSVGQVVRRNRADAEAMDKVLGNVIGGVAPFWRNEPSLREPLVDRICADLVARGDAVGAALVVDVLTRFLAPFPGVDGARQRWDVPLMRARDFVLRVMPYAAAAAIAAVGLVFFDSMYATIWAVPLLALTGWSTRVRKRYPVYPDHTSAESWLRIRYRTLGADGARQPSLLRRGAGHLFVGGTVGVVAGLFGAAFLADPAGPLGDSGARWAPSLYGLLLGGGAAVGAAVAEQVRRYLVLRAQRVRLAKEAGAAAASLTCRCWETRAFVGDVAVRYASQHLTPAPVVLPEERIAALAGVADEATLAVLGCRMTGTAWLAVTRRPSPGGRPLHHQQLLLAAPPPMPPEQDAGDEELVGGYL